MTDILSKSLRARAQKTKRVDILTSDKRSFTIFRNTYTKGFYLVEKGEVGANASIKSIVEFFKKLDIEKMRVTTMELN